MMKKGSIINLDRLVENVSLLEQKIVEIQGKNNLLEIQLEEANRLLKLSQSKETYLKEECIGLQNIIKGLRETIQNQCDLRDDNERLKNNIQLLEEKLKLNEEEWKNRIEKLLTEKKATEQEHKAILAEVQLDMNKKFEVKEAELKEMIESKASEVQALNKKMQTLEREKQNEIIKQQMEFNAKLAKIQISSVKAQHQDATILPQNIFKRKLQYLKDEKNREVASLRQIIKDLEHQLNSGQDSHQKCRSF
nr:PREDICTED: coiled-coil domain-containing protein 152 isoform X2 [Latimeria chalumnae]|eukprot:XP_006012475.2 PREDICTED: coiled-coil domain-containing protein 152 isoform X2 [Latimeria chalumnae]